jgi:CheY-like chemotaxis protein
MLETKRALIVEDNQNMADIFVEAVEEAGYVVEAVGTGVEALDRLRQAAPALVVLDMNLPQIPGTYILEHIRSQPRLADTRVIVVTVDTSLAETLHNVADLVLVKPIGYEQLRDLSARLSSEL